MQESDNVALIQKIYAAFAARDMQTILDKVNRSAEWANIGPATVPYAGSFTGRIEEFFQAIDNSTSGGKVVPVRFIEQGDTVVSIGRYTATVRATRAAIDTAVAHIFTISNGRVASWIGFSDTAAVAAAHTGAATSAAH